MKKGILLLAVLVGLECQAQKSPATSQEIRTIEVVRFKLKQDVTPENGREKLLQLNEVVSQFDGFLGRKLSQNEEGEWLDLVYWKSKEAALQAAAKAMEDPTALQVFAIIDESTMTMSHFELVQNFNN